ncbi:MAG: hypothetical protein OEU26_07705, partial [Candidatus Tectomicrobia bacterium]|nr:hypothetical protein [Candidatus Tectomicrobia bacterium]
RSDQTPAIGTSSLHGICRAVGVKLKWLLGFIVNCFETLPDHLNMQPITSNADVMIQESMEMLGVKSNWGNLCTKP